MLVDVYVIHTFFSFLASVGPCIPLFEPKSEQSPEMLHFGDFSAMDLLRVATSDCEEKKPSTIAEMLTDQIAPSTCELFGLLGF